MNRGLKSTLLISLLGALGLLCPAARAAVYYVDSTAGNDSGSGESPASPWQSLRQANRHQFLPGDQLLLKAGSRFEGQSLVLHGSGSAASPIVVDSYGQGPAPVIATEGDLTRVTTDPDAARRERGNLYSAAVYLHNVQYVEINHLELTNQCSSGGAAKALNCLGVRISLFNFGQARHIHLNGLYIHDVHGPDSNLSGGILFENKSPGPAAGDTSDPAETVPSAFDDLLIENCHILRVDREGIYSWGNVSRSSWLPNTGILIRNNLIEQVGGDGIVVIAADHAVIERNRVDDAQKNSQWAAVGIWEWSSDYTVVQYNEVSRTRYGNRNLGHLADSTGFDADYNCIGTTIQYNYSHDNQGGFVLVAATNKAASWLHSAGNRSSTIRFNLSVNDSNEIFQMWGPASGVQIDSNLVLAGRNSAADDSTSNVKSDPYAPVNGIYAGNDECKGHCTPADFPDNVSFTNNIIALDPKGEISRLWYEYGHTSTGAPNVQNLVFRKNLFIGAQVKQDYVRNQASSEPELIAPGTANVFITDAPRMSKLVQKYQTRLKPAAQAAGPG